MAFNADEYIEVIVEQIASNFDDLARAVIGCPELDKAIAEYRELASKEDVEFFTLKSAEDRVDAYQQTIGDLICDGYRTVEPLSVGLFGEWGSGKTHLLRQIEYRINQLQSNPTDKDPNILPQVTIPIFFNAWRFEKEEHLIIPLFETMLAQMQEFEHIPLDGEAKKLFRHSLRKLKILSLSLAKGLKVPDNISAAAFKIADGDLSVVGDIIDGKKVGEAYTEGSKEYDYALLFEELVKSDRLDAIYYQIPQWIEKIALFDNISFVFLIDDLDRCLPENTLKMLESIKLFLDVPSCAFVLAVDDDVVERGVMHHYRDYIPKDDKVQRLELPITGHEYLEKMIQLPFRIPVVDGVSLREFLEKNYIDLFAGIDEELVEQEPKMSEQLLEFFVRAIPPKPRKIKRAMMLFETKLKILEKLNLPIDYMVVAKITLLELFAPKLLRFIQNNGYRRIFDRLVDFQKYKDDKCKPSLSNSTLIAQKIKEYPDERDIEIYQKMMDIVVESYRSRMVFELDHIFDSGVKEAVLKQNIELKSIKVIAIEEKIVAQILSETFMQKLFLVDDETSWRDAFDDNELFAEGKGLLEEGAIDEIRAEAKKKSGFCDNPKWLGIIAEYMTQEQFVVVLKDIYPYKMEPTTVTFEEYDKYCKDIKIDKPDDSGWGRGKQPIINVSWDDATAYAKWLSEKKDQEYRLPTADEWYLACNAGQKSEWHFGDDESLLGEYAWYDKNSNEMAHPVKKKKPNRLGLYDMHGNVWEWCEDWDDKDKGIKVLRGGSWFDNAFNTRPAISGRNILSNSFNIVGFRLLKTLP